ncbi:MAG: tyrosine-type recombinase/integrase [Acidimicrobiales bacterium]
MNGYIAQRRGRFYAVISEGLDPVTGRERRTWHPAGTDRAAAECLAARLAAAERGRTDATRSLTFGAYLRGQWLPAKKLQLAASTYRSYARNVDLHVVPGLGRIGLRRLRHHHVEALYDQLLTPNAERPALSPKTVSEVHLVIGGALDVAVRRGLLTRNVALIARSPRLRAIQKTEAQSWTAEQLQAFLRAAVGHRLFPLLWLSAMTGMRRNEVLGLKWGDIDFAKKTISLNRGLVAIGYELHQTRGKTRNARRPIDLDPTTLSVLAGWKALQAAELAAVGIDNDGWVFTDGDAKPIHPHALSQTFERIARRAGVPVIRLHDLRHTHGSLLIKEGVPVKVVSERLGHANIAFTIQTYQHVLPSMQADAARTYERLTKRVPPASADSVDRRGNGRRKTA